MKAGRKRPTIEVPVPIDSFATDRKIRSDLISWTALDSAGPIFPTTKSENTMIYRNVIFRLSLFAALGLSLLPGNALAQQKSLKEQLVGTWTAVSWEQVNKDGSSLQRFGAHPKGINVFDANGRFFVMFARPDLPKIASNVPQTATAEEANSIVGGSIAYYGTYTVNEAQKAAMLRLDASTLPNQVGSEQKRTITSITADELKYTTIAVNGDKIDIVAKRAK